MYYIAIFKCDLIVSFRSVLGKPVARMVSGVYCAQLPRAQTTSTPYHTKYRERARCCNTRLRLSCESKSLFMASIISRARVQQAPKMPHNVRKIVKFKLPFHDFQLSRAPFYRLEN